MLFLEFKEISPFQFPDDSLDPVKDGVGAPVVVGGVEGDRVEHNACHNLGKH